jgi:hypothetical protein
MAKYIINKRYDKGSLLGFMAVVKVAEDDDIEDPNNLAITPDIVLQSIASPIDMQQLPEDAPTEAGGLYRTDKITILVNTKTEMEEILDHIIADIESNFKFQKDTISVSGEVTLADVCLPGLPCDDIAQDPVDIIEPFVFDPKIFVVTDK